MDKLTKSEQQTLQQLALNIVSPTSSILTELIPLSTDTVLFNIQSHWRLAVSGNGITH